MRLFLRHRFVQVQDQVGRPSSRRPARRRRATRCASIRRRRAASRRRRRVGLVFGQVRLETSRPGPPARRASAGGRWPGGSAIGVSRSSRRRRRLRVITRSASLRAASTYCASFISTSACSGVLVRPRRTDAGLAAGGVERHQRRRRGGPLPERVQAAAIERVAVVGA